MSHANSSNGRKWASAFRWANGCAAHLRDWAETLLAEKRLRDGNLFNVEHVRRHWAEHLGGQRNWQYLLWSVLMFEAWRDRWVAG